jgi:hypothetical protein
MNQLEATAAMTVSELRVGCILKKIMSSEEIKKVTDYSIKRSFFKTNLMLLENLQTGL